MGFRQENDRNGKPWIRKHYRELLLECGLTELILSSPDHFMDFLDHGMLDHHPDPMGFDITDMSLAQCARLLALLKAEECPFRGDWHFETRYNYEIRHREALDIVRSMEG
jgi:hypothetical protein